MLLEGASPAAPLGISCEFSLFSGDIVVIIRDGGVATLLVLLWLGGDRELEVNVLLLSLGATGDDGSDDSLVSDVSGEGVDAAAGEKGDGGGCCCWAGDDDGSNDG